MAMTTDPFSDILKLANAQSVVSGGFTARGAWAIRFPAPDKIKFFGVVKGHCWLCMDGAQALVRIEAGDVFLISAPRSFVLAGDLAATPIDATQVFAPNSTNIVRLGEGEDENEDFFLIGGHVRLDSTGGGLLSDILPQLIHVRAASPQATVLQWLLNQLVHERAVELPGASVASAQLAHLMFVHILRVHLASSSPLQAGLLQAMSDQRLAPVLRLMHSDPGRSWQLNELARAAAMSRTTFALHFKTVAGVAPLTYLTRWRMWLAERALREENISVSVLAHSLGYGSESAFSNAFKRTLGVAPQRYRTNHRNSERTPPTPTSALTLGDLTL